ncbi:hypothetical protein [Nocardioides sp.]|uniref:hypothetical protein n=1 Tax=Nocardioides sp. TaxID=35761 RepID=UPI003D0A652E
MSRIGVTELLTRAAEGMCGGKVAPRPLIGHLMTGVLMQDLVFVILAIAFFAVTALIVKGVERL